MLKPEVKNRWLEALRSGNYKQGTHVLKYKTVRQKHFRHCCLGVLCEIHAEETGRPWYKVAHPEKEGSQKYMRDDAALGYTVLRWSRLKDDEQCILSTMNDSGKSFATIADYIEKSL